MRILLLTPLYPPDVAEPAPYIKELSRRLAREHEVTVLAYGRLPEQVAGVRMVMINKLLPLPVRLLRYTLVLFSEVLRADAVYAENGPSVEVPAIVATSITRKPLIVHLGDRHAYHRAKESALFGLIARVAEQRAQRVVAGSPLPRPEILPFGPRPDTALAAYEASWSAHLKDIADALTHV